MFAYVYMCVSVYICVCVWFFFLICVCVYSVVQHSRLYAGMHISHKLMTLHLLFLHFFYGTLCAAV